MRIITLAENSACCNNLGAEHGLSLYIETGEHRILFDMGQSGLFADNARKLGVDLAAVDFAVVSHGHYDHGGGLETFLNINSQAPVYVSRWAFESHFSGNGGDIGLDPKWLASSRLILTGDRHTIAPGIHLLSCNDLTPQNPLEPFGQQREEGDLRLPEDYRHEQYLLLETGGKRICISGCSHKGIGNLVQWLRPDVLVGGFHLSKVESRLQLVSVARTLLASSAVFYTGHCTGGMQFGVMKEIMGDRLHPISGGTVLEL